MKKIVLIDDDANILQLTNSALKMSGYQVETLNTSLGATAKLLQSKPDLILIDVQMPGLSGPALVEVVRKLCRTTIVPVVFYSSIEEAKLKQLTEMHGALGYICKGTNIKVIVDRIGELLQKSDRSVFNQIDFTSMRRYPRLKIHFKVYVSSGESFGIPFEELTVTEDVSCGGASFILKRRPAKGSRLRLELATDRNKSVIGSICWIIPEKDGCWKIGVKFERDLENPLLFK